MSVGRIGHVFGWPLAIGLLSFAALIAGLLGEGWQDIVAWMGLCLPVAAAGWSWMRRDRERP